MAEIDYTFGAYTATLVAASGATAIATRVWRGSLVMARAMLALEDTVALFSGGEDTAVEGGEGARGVKVLELGAGRGLCGLLAHAMGSAVCVTDCSYEGMASLLPSARLAHAPGFAAEHAWGERGGELELRRHLWEADLPRSPGRGPPLHWSSEVAPAFGAEGLPPELAPGSRYDVLIASDCLYFHSQVGPLLATIAARLEPAGIALLTIVLRNKDGVMQAFLDGIIGANLRLISNTAMAVDPLDTHHLHSANRPMASAALSARLGMPRPCIS